MRTLLVTATQLEVKPFLISCGALEEGSEPEIYPGMHLAGGVFPCELPRPRDIDILITGVGQADTSFHLAQYLAHKEMYRSYALMIQAGIGGSFLSMLPKRTVVQVTSEVYGDRGAENNGSFLDLEEMGLSASDRFPYTQARLQPSTCILPPALAHLPKVPGVTVNRTLSEHVSIEWIRNRYAPAVVSMEGAPFFYAALQFGLPCIQLRSISDFVGPRDKAQWDMPGAISALNSVLVQWWVDEGPQIALRQG